MKIAVVGAGDWGKNLVRVASRLGILDTICDCNSGTLEKVRKAYPGFRYTDSYLDILDNKSIQAVIVSTPSESHYCLARQALLAGKDVFVEKPLTLTLKDGIKLVQLAKRKNRILMVGHVIEYHPAISRIKELIDTGELGKIQYIYSNRLNLGKIRKNENVLWSFAPHDISIMILLLNEMPETVSAIGKNYLRSDVADITLSTLNFSNGIKGHIFVSWLHPYKEQKLIVVADKKMVVFDDVAEKDKLLIFSHKIDRADTISVLKKENAERVEFKMEEPLVLELRHFLDCLKTRKAPKTDGQNGLRVLKVLEACQVSLEKGGAVVPLNSFSNSKTNRNNYYAHPTSVIEQPCQIGDGTKVWHYSHIMKGARIGKNCTIGQNVFIASGAELGNNVKVQNNVSIYDGVKLGDDVFCGPSVVFTNVLNPRSHISRRKEYKEIVVKKGATLGANTTLICGNSIGEYAFIGAGAVVTKDVPAYALVYGNPASLKGWICRCGIKLALKNNKATCSACKRKYTFNNGILVPC